MKFLIMLALSFTLLLASIDINTASAKELTTLKGIGKVKAQAIVDFRTTHCFKTIKELAKVKGIGIKTIEKNTNELTLSRCK